MTLEIASAAAGPCMSAWVKPSSTLGTFSLYGALPVRMPMSSLVSLRAHSIVVGMWPLLVRLRPLAGDEAEVELAGPAATAPASGP